MGHVYIVGDIHGCCQELDALVSGLPLTRNDHLIFLGDYIDRGPAAREVVDFLLGLKAARLCRTTFLRGNHEDMFLDFLGLGGRFGEAFLMNGGNATLQSYRMPEEDGTRTSEWLPPEHLKFFTDLEMSTVKGDVLCVHAGVNPLLSLEEQHPEDLLWIRQEFLNHPHVLPYTVVFGHTPQRAVRFELPYKIGLDTGLVYGGKLSCLDVTEKVLYQVAKGSTNVAQKDVAHQWRDAPSLLAHTLEGKSVIHQVLPQRVMSRMAALKTGTAVESRESYRALVYEDASATVSAAIRDRRGLIVLLGQPGVGKTTLVQSLKNLPGPTIHEVACGIPEMSFAAVLSTLSNQLSLNPATEDETVKLDAIESTLWMWAYRGEASVLVLDNAHNLSREALKKLPQLLSVEGPYGKLLQVLLVARPELEEMLAGEELQAVRERIAERYRLVPLHENAGVAFSSVATGEPQPGRATGEPPKKETGPTRRPKMSGQKNKPSSAPSRPAATGWLRSMFKWRNS